MVEGAQLEALPVFGPDLNSVIAKYYDNRLNIFGNGNSTMFGTESIGRKLQPHHHVYIKHILVKAVFVRQRLSTMQFEKQQQISHEFLTSYGFITNITRSFKSSTSR